MYKFLILLSLTFISSVGLSQIGIGTTSPHASAVLDIESNNGGLLVPRMTEDNRTSINSPAIGLLVFQTDGKAGFYYFNGSDWLNISTIHRINDLMDGRTDSAESSLFLGENAGLNDNNTQNHNVGIGTSSLQENISGEHNVGLGHNSLAKNTTGKFNTGVGSQALASNIDGYSNIAVGFQSIFVNTDGNNNVGIGDWSLKNNLLGNGNTAIGFRSGENNVGSGNLFLGNQSGQNEMASNTLYIENSSADADNALIYGEFDNNILRTNGTLQIGNPSTGGYAFPDTIGTIDQVLISDGNGNILWIDKTILGGNQLNDLTDARSDNDGSNNGSSVYIGINAGKDDDLLDNRNVAVGYQSLMSNIGGHENSAVG